MLTRVNLALLLLLGILVLLLAQTIRADELDFSKHHPSGAAIISHDGQQWVAAYQQDEFNVGHEPLGLSYLFRLVLVPADSALLQHTEARDGAQSWSAWPTIAGHLVVDLGDWQVELIPIEPEQRDASIASAKAMLGSPITNNQCRVRIETRRDAVLITVIKEDK